MKYIIIFFSICLGTGLYSCKKEPKEYSLDQNGTKTSYPEIKLKGDKFMSINVGSTFADPGITYTDSIYPTNLQTSIENTINPSKAGMYTVIYEVKNEYGFKSKETRFVAVTDISNNFDISGNYKRGTAGLGTLSKVGRGLFSFDNCGGLAPGNPPGYYVKLYFAFIDSTTMVCPEQPTDFGTGYFERATISYAAPVTFKWYLINPGFGAGTLRVFVKQ